MPTCVYFSLHSTFPLLPKSKLSSLYPSFVAVQPIFMSDLVGNPEDRFPRDRAQADRSWQTYSADPDQTAP